MQIGLHVISVEGYLIRNLKSYVLKCSACLSITHKTSAEFCPSCGNYALYRIQMRIDQEGNIRYLQPRAKKFNLRGTKYSLPAPSVGRNHDIILRADQKERKFRQKAKGAFDVFNPDHLVYAGAPFGSVSSILALVRPARTRVERSHVH
eukprot:m.318989 g.318989  ORF g.318989 m.318989 type:complete len:149 (-) comp55488_c0_seq40:1309-1755(-)